MVKKIWVILIGLVVLGTVAAAIPQKMNFQGRLTDTSGNPITTAVDVKFSIYDAALGGTELWTETISGLTPDQGLVNQELGLTTSIAASVFSTDTRYLAVKVGADAEMSPRIPLASVPFAFRAATADTVPNNSLTLNKFATGQIVTSIASSGSMTTLKDNVVIEGGSGVTISQDNLLNKLTITAVSTAGGTVSQVNTGTGLTGGPITATGTISIANGGVAAGQLATGAVTGGAIADDTITEAKLNVMNAAANNTVLSYTPTGMAWSAQGAGGDMLKSVYDVANNGRVDYVDNLTIGQVTSGAIASNAITASSLGTGSVTSGAIAIAAIQSSNLGTNVVTASAIANGAVTSGAIAINSILASNLGTNVITAAAISTGAVTAGAIAGGQVVTSLASSGAAALHDAVTISGGSGITLNQVGQNIQITAVSTAGGTVTQVNTGSGLTGGPINTTGTVSIAAGGINATHFGTGVVTAGALANTAVTPGTYTNSNITVDQQGRLTAAATGGAGTVTGSGVADKVAFWTNASSLGANSNFHWDNTNGGLAIGSAFLLSTDRLFITTGNTTNGYAAVRIAHNGAAAGGNNYGIYVTKQGASSNNYGGYFEATGATTNYGAYGYGADYGLYGTSPSGIGVGADGSQTGVWGYGGYTGVYGRSTLTGVGGETVDGQYIGYLGTRFYLAGVYGETISTSEAVHGKANNANSTAIFAEQANASGYAVRSTGGKNYFQGNTGIGTANPQALLHVQGNLKVTGTIEGASPVKIKDQLDINGGVKVGSNIYGAQTGLIEFDGANFRGYNGASWVNFGAGSLPDLSGYVQLGPTTQQSTTAAYGINVKTTNASGVGISGETTAGAGYGVFGLNSSATGGTGGYFRGGVRPAIGRFSIGVFGITSTGNYYGELGREAPTTMDNSTDSGVYGYTSTLTGHGVYGLADATTGAGNNGGYFEADGDTGTGVYGYGKSSAGGKNFGVYGRTDSGNGYGVYGAGTSDGYGVYGYVNAMAMNSIALCGETAGPDGYALVTRNGPVSFETSSFDINTVHYIWPSANPGSSTVLTNDGAGALSWEPSGGVDLSGYVKLGPTTAQTTTAAYAVRVKTTNASGVGISGEATTNGAVGIYGLSSYNNVSGSGNTGYGVYGMANSYGGHGVHGVALAGDGADNIGVYGYANGNQGWGVVGQSINGPSGGLGGNFYGVRGSYDASNYGIIGGSGTGVEGHGLTYGVYGGGGSYGVYGTGASVGGYFHSNNSSGFALQTYQQDAGGFSIYASGGKNYFQGKVGIGVTDPSATLQVQGNMRILGSIEGYAAPVAFKAGIRLANETDTTAGNIRWNGSNFQGYNGSSWVNLDASGGIGGSAAANKVAYGSGVNTLTSTTNFDFNGTDLSVGTTTKNGRVHGYYNANNYGYLGANGTGVYGWSGNASGFGGSFGVEGAGAYGVYASCYATGYGVYGYNNDYDTIGYLASDNYGAYGKSTTSTIYGGLGYNYGSFPKGAMGTTARTSGFLGDSAPNGNGYHAGVTGLVVGSYLNSDVAVAAYNESEGSYASLGGVHSGVYGYHGIMGVSGEASNSTGVNYGGIFTTYSTSGYGVYARARTTSGTNYGAYGVTSSPNGYGVYGYNASASNGGTAGYFKAGYYTVSSLDLGRGLLVESRSNSITVEVVREYTIMDGTGEHYGIKVMNARPATSGIITAGGYFNAVGGGASTSYGVIAGSSGLTGAGVYGGTSSSNVGAYGVYGEAARTSTYGILGNDLYGAGGTYNRSTGPYGWLGTANYGAYGYYNATHNGYVGGSLNGVYGEASGSGHFGVYGYNDNSAGVGVQGYCPAGGTGWAVYANGGRLGTGNAQTGATKSVYDVAELIPCAPGVTSADVVVVHAGKYREAVACTLEADAKALGIISYLPQLSIGDRDETNRLNPGMNWQYVALAGQVPCKVSIKNGQINPGDLLTTSDIPGHAVKALGPGQVIGKALEKFDGSKGATGQILVFCNVSWYGGNQQKEIEQLKSRLKALEEKINK